MKDLSVIIVNYNVRYYVEQCLHSVFAAQGDYDMEVFVVDNASTDDSVAYLSERFPNVHIIANTDNRGFSRANNQAIREAKGRYILLLNPDTIVTETTFKDCITFLEQHPEVGATGVAMYGTDGRFAWESRRGIPTPWTSFCKMIGLAALFPHSRRFGRYHMRYLNREEYNYIEIMSGAFMMIRREVLDKVGLLDETFFMYGEDIDLSYRILQAGWRNAYLPTPIIHYKGESTQKSSYRYVQRFYEAMLIFFDKHLRQRYRFMVFIIRSAVYMRAAIGMGIRFFKHMLPRKHYTTVIGGKVLCLSEGATLEKMRELCKRNGFEPVDKAGTDVNIWLFDSQRYTYGDMLSKTIAAYGRGENIMMATYNPKTAIMIMTNGIFK